MSQLLFFSLHQKNKKFSSPSIRHCYAEKPRVFLRVDGPSRTKQSFKDECDINNIMARFKRTGVLDFAARHEPRYGDCTGLDFQKAMLTVAAARSMFEELPAQLRARFENDPGQFLLFVNDEKNRAEAKDLGLLKPETEWADAQNRDSLRGAPDGVLDGSGAGAVRRKAGRADVSGGDAGGGAPTVPTVVKAP